MIVTMSKELFFSSQKYQLLIGLQRYDNLSKCFAEKEISEMEILD
jgi:hypothetical protein